MKLSFCHLKIEHLLHSLDIKCLPDCNGDANQASFVLTCKTQDNSRQFCFHCFQTRRVIPGVEKQKARRSKARDKIAKENIWFCTRNSHRNAFFGAEVRWECHETVETRVKNFFEPRPRALRNITKLCVFFLHITYICHKQIALWHLHWYCQRRQHPTEWWTSDRETGTCTYKMPSLLVRDYNQQTTETSSFHVCGRSDLAAAASACVVRQFGTNFHRIC